MTINLYFRHSFLQFGGHTVAKAVNNYDPEV